LSVGLATTGSFAVERLTHEVIPYPCELDQVLELGMSQNLSRHCISPWVRDNALWLAVLVIFDLNNAGSKAFFELLLMFPWDETTKDNVGEKTV